MKKYKVAIVGCGMIADNYMHYASTVYTDYYEIIATGDIYVDKAKAFAEKHNLKFHGTPDVIYASPDIDIVLNLTVPTAHEDVTIAALKAGKHVYSEKPLACSVDGMKRIMETAKKCGKRVGCAPDSFMSAPAQTAKKAIEDDWIGDPIAVSAFCPNRGNEYWHPNPDFFYKQGAGPMMDMAPYYLNIFISMFGSVESVMAMGKKTWDTRTIKLPPRRGEKIDVEVSTHVTSILKFKSGVIVNFTNSFDVWHTRQPNIEIHGEKGSMVMSDPNQYAGDVLIRRFNDSEWRSLPQFVEYSEYGRGIGIVDMIRSIESDTPHRASLELAYHATDVILAMYEAEKSGSLIKIDSVAPQPSGLWHTPETILWK